MSGGKRGPAKVEPYRAQHLALSRPGKTDSAPDAAAVVDNESPLAWLRRRRDRSGQPLIGACEFAAGERLRADFTRARMTPRVTADWERPAGRRGRGDGPGDPAMMLDSAIAARERMDAALESAGPVLGALLQDVCCFLVGLEEAERARGWPRRSGKVVLQVALERLAAHYGMSDSAEGPAGGGRIRHWGASDYRPSVSEETGSGGS